MTEVYRSAFDNKRRGGAVGLTCFLIVVALLINHEGSKAYLRRLSVRDIAPPSTIGIVHLGQCHGLDLEGLLKNHRNDEGNALAKHPHNMYYHIPRSLETDQPQPKQPAIWIALIRDPIDRIIAAWNFEHPTNRPFRKYPTKVSDEMRAKKTALYKCYNTIDDFATRGLSDALELASSITEGADTTSCAFLVRDLLENRNPFPDMVDFKLNYGHYYQSLLDSEEQHKKVFVVRTEHMVHDLNKVNVLMGGRSNVYSNNDDAETTSTQVADAPFQSQYWAQDISNNPLAVSSTVVSKEGLDNLCRILCHEIQLYQQLVHEAANAHSVEVAEMTISLRTKCGADIANMLTPLQQRRLKHRKQKEPDFTCPRNPWI